MHSHHYFFLHCFALASLQLHTSTYARMAQELHSMGARKFAIINVGPVGCVPAVRVLDAAGTCADGLNQLAAGFDDALGPLLAGLAAIGLRINSYKLATTGTSMMTSVRDIMPSFDAPKNPGTAPKTAN